MPRDATAVLASIAVFVTAMGLACGNGTDRPSPALVSDIPPARMWYEGGTLHGKTALDWQIANFDDKLATCGDFIAKVWEEKNFNPTIQQSINSMDDMRPYAEKLVMFLDAATKKDPDPDRNIRMYANQTVSSLAAIAMVSMQWTN